MLYTFLLCYYYLFILTSVHTVYQQRKHPRYYLFILCIKDSMGDKKEKKKKTLFLI